MAKVVYKKEASLRILNPGDQWGSSMPTWDVSSFREPFWALPKETTAVALSRGSAEPSLCTGSRGCYFSFFAGNWTTSPASLVTRQSRNYYIQWGPSRVTFFHSARPLERPPTYIIASPPFVCWSGTLDPGEHIKAQKEWENEKMESAQVPDWLNGEVVWIRSKHGWYSDFGGYFNISILSSCLFMHLVTGIEMPWK